MTRMGAHKYHYHWGGGGVDVGRRRFDEIMGLLLVGHDDLRKLESCLSEWRCSPDYPAMREALKAVTRIHRSALSTGHIATKLQLIRAGHLSRRLVKKAVRTQSKLRSMLRNAPPPEPPAQKPKLRLGGLSLREMSGGPFPKPNWRSRATGKPKTLTPKQKAKPKKATEIEALRKSLVMKHKAEGKPPAIIERVPKRRPSSDT